MSNIVAAVLLPIAFIVFVCLIFYITLLLVDYIKEYSVLKIKGSGFGIALAIIAIVITAINIGLMAIK